MTLTMGTNTGMQGTVSPEKTTYNPQPTVNPQQTVSGTSLQTTYNPQVSYSPPASTQLGYTAPPAYTAPVAPPPPPPPDPYEQWGGIDKYNSLVSGFDSQKDGIFSSARDAGANSAIGYKSTILDFIDQLRSGQQGIDQRGINNELAKQRGTADIYGGISRGIQSAGVTLANKNASDSSAAEAIARAYGSIGQRQLSDIGNQYGLENEDINMAQQELGRMEQAGVRRLGDDKQRSINSIVIDANNSLAALDAQIANASLPDRIAIDQEKNRIRSEVTSMLSKYDASLNQGRQDVNAMGNNERISEANRRAQLGQAPAQAFDYSAQVPTQFQQSGPFASNLPIFSYRNKEEY